MRYTSDPSVTARAMTFRDRLIQRIGQLAEPSQREAVEARWRARFEEDGRKGMRAARLILRQIRQAENRIVVH